VLNACDGIDAMRRTLGDRTVDRFAKLYLFPGMAHCGGGEGPNTTDVLTPVMAWVESGREPGRIVASNATLSRAVSPYDARHDSGPDYHWVGEALFSHGYQTQAKAINGKLVLFPPGGWFRTLR
jgi:feruloyl esterase